METVKTQSLGEKTAVDKSAWIKACTPTPNIFQSTLISIDAQEVLKDTEKQGGHS